MRGELSDFEFGDPRSVGGVGRVEVRIVPGTMGVREPCDPRRQVKGSGRSRQCSRGCKLY